MNTRDFTNWNGYLDELMDDVYPSPADDGHTALLTNYMGRWGKYFKGAKNVLDVGCGDDAIAEPFFRGLGISYLGISIGANVDLLASKGRCVVNTDFNFLSDFVSESFDLVFSRHSLEHSPAPLLSLMEWHRVSSKYLGLIVPNPADTTFVGRNHYSVANSHQMVWWLRRAGWKIEIARFTKSELQFVCTKMPRISYEGFVKAPLSAYVHESERDMLDTMDEDIFFGGFE